MQHRYRQHETGMAPTTKKLQTTGGSRQDKVKIKWFQYIHRIPQGAVNSEGESRKG